MCALRSSRPAKPSEEVQPEVYSEPLMPLTPEFTSRVTAQLEAARPIRHRKMFGGLGLYLGDVFFAVADDDRLYFKVDGQTLGDYEARGMGPWILGGEVNDKYREVPTEVLADPGELGVWIDRSAEAAKRLKK